MMVSPLFVGKFSGGQQGSPGSITHITTNDNLSTQGKLGVLQESAKECAKDTFSLCNAVGVSAVAGSLAVANSNKCADMFKSALAKTSEVLGNSSINGKNVKDLIKNTKVFDKINGLPIAAKAGIAAGVAAFVLFTPLVALNMQAKAGYIEGKHEGQ